MEYNVRFIHKISPSPTDTKGPVEIPDKAFSNRRTLGYALRFAGVLCRGERIATFRVEGAKVIVFPQATIWHSIILEPAKK